MTPRVPGGIFPAALLLLVALAAPFGLPGGARALEVPPRPAARINDAAGVLSAGERGALEQQLQAFEQATSNQIVVATFPSLESEDLDDYVVRLFKAWNLGQQGRDNGILLAVFMAEKRVRIEVGYGLEGAVPDAMASRIIRNELAPEFREGRPGNGIARAVTALMAATKGEYKGIDRPQRTKDPGIPIGLIVFIIFVIIALSSRANRGHDVVMFPPATPGAFPRRRRARNSDWGGFGGFGGGFGGGGGDGGFGGFSGGGGRSGGGGASGGW